MSESEVSERLLALYRKEIRPLLEEHQAPGLEAVDQLAAVLERARARKTRLDFGFVGESQVGKSTLINALLGRKALPSGGIGPLTAQATEVRFGEENSIWVRYHSRKELNQLSFALERYLVARGDLSVHVTATVDLAENEDLTISVPDDGARTTEKGEHFLKQARLMLTGTESDDVAISNVALLDGIRAVLGQAPRGEVADELAPHQARIEVLRTKCQNEEVLTEKQLGSARTFDRELSLRAAGALAPLVAELKVTLNTAFLRHATLIDLPGIGVVGDPAARVAEEFVRLRGDALIIVVRNNGLPGTIADLLERTGVITKLLFGAAHGEPAIRVLIAVTHLDDVAKDAYAKAVTQARESGDRLPDRHQIFEEMADEMRATIRRQVEAALRESRAFEDLSADHKSRREEIVSRLCADLTVLVVAANDFLLLSEGLEDVAFLRRQETTAVPAFRAHVEQLAAGLVQTRDDSIHAAVHELHGVLEDHIAMVAELYEEGGGRASAEWDRFRSELDRALTPLREQMKAHHGEVLATLRSTIPTRIELLCKSAEQAATKKLGRLRRHGETELHVKSLEAALRRNGVWGKKSIDYPDALTRAFVDSVASDWEPMIIEAIKGTMRSLADRDISLVEQLCELAAGFDEKLVAEAHIDTQKRVLQQQSRACVAWTREKLEELSESVRTTLVKEVSKPIEKASAAALKRGANQKAGAKQRILDAFEEGGAAAIEVASGSALRILRHYHQKLVQEIETGYFEEHHDPLQAAYDALTKEEFGRARRSDAQRKRRVLDQVAAQGAALQGAQLQGGAR